MCLSKVLGQRRASRLVVLESASKSSFFVVSVVRMALTDRIKPVNPPRRSAVA